MADEPKLVINDSLNYRFADAVLQSPSFKESRTQLCDIITNTHVPLLDPAKLAMGGVKKRKRKPLKGSSDSRYFLLPVDQKTLNKRLDKAFKDADWETQPHIVKGDHTGVSKGLKGDFKKGRIQVEVQFGNMARWYTDVFKFQLAYAQGDIEVGVLVVAMQYFANLIDENVVHFERVSRELPAAKMSLTLPIWVLGVEPDDYSTIETVYVAAFETLRENLERTGERAVLIPMRDRGREEDPDDPDG